MLARCKKLSILFLTLLVLLMQNSSAQNVKVEGTGGKLIFKGTLVDDYSRPLSKVSIGVNGTNNKVVSADDGSFAIEAQMGNTIIFSHPNFNTRVEVVGKNNGASFKLNRQYVQRPERLSVLYDEVDPAKSLSSIATVYTNQLNTTPASIYPYALTGRLAGLYTAQIRGFQSASTAPSTEVDIFVGNIPIPGRAAPNDNTEIALRLRGQAPVVIVDGVQRDISSLDPENIESVSVLKDAMSTIFLGQRSSRGVMLVTTKKPQAGAPRLSFTAQTGIQTPIDLPKALPSYQYAYLLNEALQNDGRLPAYTEKDFNAFRSGSSPFTHPDVDWQKTILRENAPIASYNLNIDGGGSVARYFVSLGYFNQQGMFNTSPKNDYNTNVDLSRYIINSNVDIDVTDDFNIGLQLFGRLQDGNQPGATIGSVMSSLISTPNGAYPVYNVNGSYGGNNTFQDNLLARVQDYGYLQDKARDVMVNIDMKYKLDRVIKGLWVKAKANLSIQSVVAVLRNKRGPVFQMAVSASGDTTYPQYGGISAQNNGFVTVSTARYGFAQAGAGIDRQFGKHGISAMVLADQRKEFINFDLPGTATNISGKTTYNYGNKYFGEAALNYSGYDRYKPGSQFGWFYAGGVGWDIAQEDFIIKNASWINQLKLRSTYGQTGNGIDNSGYFIWRSTYSNIFSTYSQGTAHSRGDGVRETNLIANPNISWEKAHKWNIGTDISLFKNKLQITGDYYRDKYFDLLRVRGKNTALIGNVYPPENIGINRFTGLELSLTYQNNYRNFNYFITGNVSSEQSKVLFMDEQARQNEWNKNTGQPVGMPFGLLFDGFFQSKQDVAASATTVGYSPLPGDIKYKDLNQDGIIDQFDYAPLFDNAPQIYYGTTVGFNIKGFELSVLLQGVHNRQMLLNGPTELPFQSQGQLFSQTYEQWTNRWTPENAATATYPRLSAGGNGNNFLPFTTFWVHSGDYFRVKNVHLEYNIPVSLAKKLKLAGVKVFVNAVNLFTHAAYDRVDPEVNGTNYPIQRVINTGINIKI